MLATGRQQRLGYLLIRFNSKTVLSGRETGPTTESSSKIAGIGETKQKREESLLNALLAVSALGSEQFETRPVLPQPAIASDLPADHQQSQYPNTPR